MQMASETARAAMQTDDEETGRGAVEGIVRMGKGAAQLVAVMQSELALLQRCEALLRGLYNPPTEPATEHRRVDAAEPSETMGAGATA
jgi:hypothetical protein